MKFNEQSMNQTEKYYSLIKNWHAKASEEDYFSKFMFEYLAFIAYLRTQWRTEQEVRSIKRNGRRVTDRDYIQALKQDQNFSDFWIDLTLRSTKDKDLVKVLTGLASFLKREPLRSSNDLWWNFDGFDLNRRPVTSKRAGIIHNVGDLKNLIEFWYSVRNNLFHGDKNPSLGRDRELVRFAFLTLHFFVENVLLVLKEMRRVYPAIWEDFWRRFKSGEAEINTKADGGGVTANIYECAFLEDRRYPLLLLDRHLTRNDIIDVINTELAMSGEMATETWPKIKSAAGSKKKELKEYFGETVNALNKTLALRITLK